MIEKCTALIPIQQFDRIVGPQDNDKIMTETRVKIIIMKLE